MDASGSRLFIWNGFSSCFGYIVPHLHFTEEKPEGVPSQLKKTTMLVLAVTLHNIPEGMAVGVTFAGVMTENSVISLAGALALSNWDCNSKLSGRGNYIPCLCKVMDCQKERHFIRGNVRHCRTDCGGDHHFLTGIAVPLLPYLLSFAAGAMIYVVVEELFPNLRLENIPISNDRSGGACSVM